MLLSNTDISSWKNTKSTNVQKPGINRQRLETWGVSVLKCHLVVRLGEVVQAGDVLQEHSKLCRQVFEHQPMVVGLLQLPNMFLRGEHTHSSHPSSLLPFSVCRGMTSYLVLDLPPRQLAHQELHQHVEERPQVVVAAHLLQGDTSGFILQFSQEKISRDSFHGIPTLFLCALTDA